MVLKETVMIAKQKYDELLSKTHFKDTKSVLVQTEDINENNHHQHDKGIFQVEQSVMNGVAGILDIAENKGKIKRKKKTKKWLPY